MYAQISKIVVLLAAAILLALTGQAEAKQITLRWTKRSMKATGMDGRRRLDARRKIMKVCSGDVVHFKWSGEQMGLYGFYNEGAYRKCAKGNLNYMKNTRANGSFKTKANRSGWRYYAHISGAGDGACKYGCGNKKNKTNRITGTCQQRIAIHWGC